MNLLVSHHAQSESVCKWVVENFSDDKYSDNKTVQEWVKQSSEQIEQEQA